MGNGKGRNKMESFKASTQYGDWEGTVSADAAQANSLRELLQARGLIKPNEFLVAASFYYSEGEPNPVRALVFEGENKYESVQKVLTANSGPIPVREINVELTAEEFLRLFKRFHVMLTWHGFELEERGYSAA
jgi:hypothetical protein